jgi:hypothetical protein
MRFYKPRLREYVSTQVDMPWEFLQGVAEQKQKGYDTALATGDTASKLLNFEVNPGDMPGKKKVQDEYNQRIYGITDYIRQTGDFNAASREFANIIRDVSQDQRIKVMTSAVEPHKEVMKNANKLLEEGSAPWSVKANPNYQTYNPETGELKPYNQRAGYNSVTANKNYRDQMEETVNNLIAQQYGQTTISPDGQFLITSDGSRIDRKRVEALVMDALPSIDMANNQYVSDLDLLDEQLGRQKGLSRLGIANSVINERVFSSGKSHATRDPLWMYNYQQQYEKAQEQLAIPVEDVGIKSEGKVFDISKTTYTYQKPIPGKDINYNVTEYESPYKLKTEGKLTNDEWHMMGNYLMKANPSLYDKVFVKDLGSKATQGELQQAYEQFKNYHDILYASAGSNAKVRAVTDPTDLHAMFGGVKKADLTLADLTGAPGIGGQAYVYDLTNNKFLSIEELKNQVGDKKLKVNINKEVLPYNGFSTVAEINNIPNPNQFVTGYGFTLQGPSGEEGNQYIIGKPPEYRNNDEIAANKLYNTKLIPGKVEEVIVNGKKVYAVYDPDVPLNDFALARQQGQDVGGKIYVYKTKDAANRLSRNPNDFILEPQGTRDDDNYIYLSDPVNVLMNLKEKLKEEKNK